jgi:hypothetical protein
MVGNERGLARVARKVVTTLSLASGVPWLLISPGCFAGYAREPPGPPIVPSRGARPFDRINSPHSRRVTMLLFS